MSYQLLDEFRIVGIQNYNLYEKLNPFYIIMALVKYKENYQDMALNIINTALLSIVC